MEVGKDAVTHLQGTTFRGDACEANNVAQVDGDRLKVLSGDLRRHGLAQLFPEG